MIAIIAILAAILFPVFAKAREKARAASCTSNVKQQILAVTQYIQDYDEMMMPIRVGGPGTPYFAWTELIQPYMKSEAVLVCPSAGATKFSYTMQWSIWAGGGASLASVPRPANTPVLMDAVGASRTSTVRALHVIIRSGSAGWIPMLGRTTTDTYGMGDGQRAAIPDAQRHTGGANYAFFDGHVKWLKPEYDARETGTGNPYDLWCVPKTGLDWRCTDRLGPDANGDYE